MSDAASGRLATPAIPARTQTAMVMHTYFETGPAGVPSNPEVADGRAFARRVRAALPF